VPKPGTKERALYDQFLMMIFLDIEALGLWTHRKFIDLALYSSNSDLMNDLQYIHIPEAASPAKVTFERSLKILAEELKKHKFLLGDNFTALDIHLLRDLEWADALDWLTGNPDESVLRRYYDDVRMREAYKTCWKLRQPLDLSSKALNTFTPQNQSPPIGLK
jgi:glutathione S-transferase